jgi:RNA polymerase sigma-70 factor (ECF subfamily)
MSRTAAFALALPRARRANLPAMTGASSAASAGQSQIEADAALMHRVAAGDQAAARQVVDRHLSGAIGFAWRMLGERSLAEDVAQEAFLRLWRQAPRWRAKARIGTWLRTVLYNACVDQLRRRRPQTDITAMELADGSPTPAEAHQSSQVAAVVQDAVAALPERQRAAIALVHYDGMTNIEAAEVLDVSVDALESLLARGRRSLRDRLEDLRDDLLGTTE